MIKTLPNQSLEEEIELDSSDLGDLKKLTNQEWNNHVAEARARCAVSIRRAGEFADKDR